MFFKRNQIRGSDSILESSFVKRARRAALLPGTLRGTPASAPVLPPPPLPPIEPVALGAALLTENVEEAVAVMIEAYQRIAGFSPALKRNADGEWFGMLRRAAAMLNRERVSVAGFVEYVVTLHVRRQGRRPWPAQVFGQKAVERWLPEYSDRSRAVLPAPTYVASSARRAIYEERVNGRRLRTER
jgi:hypothetical protein